MRIVKILAVLALGIAVLALSFNYFVRAATVTAISGYLILLDQKVSQDDYMYLGEKTFSTIVYLPTNNAEGIVTYCSFTFPDGIDEKADITKDGIVDYADLYLVSKSYGCEKNQACWNQTFNIEKCYFTYSGKKFQDPSGDCYINETDLNLVNKNYGKTTNPSSPNCDLDEVCKSDVNKDGIIDISDIALLGFNFKKYANEFENYRNIKKGDTDLNKDGIVDISDISIVARNFGSMANHQNCSTTNLENLGNNKYRIKVNGRGLYYVGVSYKIVPV